MPWLRVLFTGISPRILGLNSRSVNVSFIVETTALGRIAFWVLWPVFVRSFRINAPHSYSSAYCCYQEDTTEKPGKPPKTTIFWNRGALVRKAFPFYYLEATKRSLFQVFSSWFLVLLSHGIIVSSHCYSFVLALHFSRSHVRNIMKLLK